MSGFSELRRFIQDHRALHRNEGEPRGHVISPVIQHSGLGAFGGLGDFVSQTGRIFADIEWALPLTSKIRKHVGSALEPPLANIAVQLYEPFTREAFTFDMEVRAHRRENNSLTWLFYNADLIDLFGQIQRIQAARRTERAAELKRISRFYSLLINQNAYYQSDRPPVQMTMANTPELRQLHPLIRRYINRPDMLNALMQGAISKAIVALMAQSAVNYDVVWVHDWHFCAIAGELLLEQNRSLAENIQYVQHLHNALHQGVYTSELADILGWPSSHFSDRLYRVHGQFNLLGGALNALRFQQLNGKAVAVSQTHASELPTFERGAGLDRIFKRLRDKGKLTGINNPITMPGELIISDERDLDAVKPETKQLVQSHFGLAMDSDAFLLLWSNRFTQQKQVTAVLRAIELLFEAGHDDLQIAFFCDIFEGSTSSDVQYLHDLINRYPANVATDAFNARDEMLIAAGVDGSLMASYFEPFGYAPVWVGMQGGFIITGANGGQVDIFDPQTTFFLDIQPDIDKPEWSALRSWRDVRYHLLLDNASHRNRIFEHNTASIRDGILEAKTAFSDRKKRRQISLSTMRRIRELTKSGYFSERIRDEIMATMADRQRYSEQIQLATR